MIAGAAVFAVVAALPDVVGVVPGSVVAGSDGPGGGASGCELAAIAAAAMANGAVETPEAGAVAGTLVVGVDVGTTTATGVGVVGELPTCCARMVASTAVASAASALDLWSPDFESPCVVVAVVVDWLAPLAVAPLLVPLAGAPEPEPASDDGALLAVLLESPLAGACGAGVLLPALAALLLALFAGAGSPDDGGEAAASFCWGGGGGGGSAAEELLGVFWLTRFPKRSFAGALDRVSHDGAAWNEALAAAAASWVALSTGWSPAREFTKQSAKTGPLLMALEYIATSNGYDFGRSTLGPPSAPSFLPGGKICRFRSVRLWP